MSERIDHRLELPAVRAPLSPRVCSEISNERQSLEETLHELTGDLERCR
jgi:hypothetical protein